MRGMCKKITRVPRYFNALSSCFSTHYDKLLFDNSNSTTILKLYRFQFLTGTVPNIMHFMIRLSLGQKIRIFLYMYLDMNRKIPL